MLMKTLALLFLPLIAHTCFAQFKLTQLDKNSIPRTIQYKGHIVNAVRWRDSLGENIIIATETGIIASDSSIDNGYKDAALYCCHYLVNSDSIKQTWKIYDFINECNVDIKASFIKNSFSVTDLDKDGKAEIWLMYETLCAGDISPANMKIIMYEAEEKYALRGTRKVWVSPNEAVGGECTFDDAFRNGPEKFRNYALQLWEKHIRQTWE